MQNLLARGPVISSDEAIALDVEAAKAAKVRKRSGVGCLPALPILLDDDSDDFDAVRVHRHPLGSNMRWL